MFLYLCLYISTVEIRIMLYHIQIAMCQYFG